MPHGVRSRCHVQDRSWVAVSISIHHMHQQLHCSSVVSFDWLKSYYYGGSLVLSSTVLFNFGCSHARLQTRGQIEELHGRLVRCDAVPEAQGRAAVRGLRASSRVSALTAVRHAGAHSVCALGRQERRHRHPPPRQAARDLSLWDRTRGYLLPVR